MQGIYPGNFESKIGFDRIREMLKSRCISALGEEYAEAMHFETSFPAVSILLGETDEFLRIIKEFPAFPTDFYFDVRDALNNIRLEGRFMEVEDLFDLKRSLETLRSISHFFDKDKERSLPLLCQKAQKIRIYPYIFDKIDAILNKSGVIRDNASSELARIRREIVSMQSGISKRLQAILKQAQKEGWAEEGASVAIRDGRAVIPVPSANKKEAERHHL